MSNNSAPAAPDYTPIANAAAASAASSAKIAQEQLDWAKQQYADNKGTTDQVVKSFLDTQNTTSANAAADRARYQDTFQPLEDSLAKDANSYASDDRKNLERGRAGATVAQNFESQRTNAARDLESFGIDPTSTRYAALDIGVRSQQAAATAGAENQSDQMVDATGRALRSEAINVGRGYPGQIAGTYNTALQAGTGAVNSDLATTASGANTMGTGATWTGLQNSSLGTQTQALNTGFNNATSQFNANQNASTGAGSILGLIAGIGGSAAKSYFAAADGGAIPGPADGGAVPVQVSPSRGRAVDDVPAKLSAGEFIMPKQAVEWHGQKAMYAMIEKADKERAEAKQRTGAVPQVRSSATQRPASAIPMQMAA